MSSGIGQGGILMVRIATLFAIMICASGLAAPSSADDAERLKLREDEITARIGKHFYSWREGGAGFTIVGIADRDSVYVKYDGSGKKTYTMYVRLPNEEWQTEDPFGGKINDRKVLISVLDDIEKRCSAGRPKIGMTKLEAYLEWCRPYGFNITETAAGVREQWVYEDRGYLYFESGRLVAIQRNN
jgi:hypothetical protein